MLPVLVLLALTGVWGYTFVPTKEATALYPVVAFLAVRFVLATGALGLAAAPRLRRLPRAGWAHGAAIGVALGASIALQTAGLHRTSVSSTGFITGLYVVLTPLIGLLLFRQRVGLLTWAGALVSVAGLGLLAGAPGSDVMGDLLVLASCVTQAFQILFIGRWAERHDGIALAWVEVATAAVCLVALAAALGELHMPHGGKVWYGLVVTAVPGTALAMVAQIWVQRRVSAARAAILFTLEVPFAALFGIVLLGDDLGALGWLGGALMLTAIVAVEPPVAAWIRSASARRAARPSRPARSSRPGAGP